MKLAVKYSFSLTQKRTAKTRQEKVDALVCKLLDMPPAPYLIKEYWGDGLYAREMTIPEGCTAVGVIHKTNHVCTLSKGTLLIYGEDAPIELTAPCTFVAGKDSQKVVYAVSECVITNYHATTETDVDVICKQVTYASLEELVGGDKNIQRLHNEAKKQGEHLWYGQQ